MDAESFARAERLFHASLDLPPEARARFLDEACAGDAALRLEIESLLRLAVDAPSYLDRPLIPRVDPAVALLSAAAAVWIDLPCRIGAYRLVREIGSGGMGTVYEAWQEGIDRHVAFKLLRPAMATDVFLRRFRAEQRILAGLEHPGIARLYDAGTTPEGLPYLVMEYVQGTTVLAYCNARELDVTGRVRLFVRICESVQHAHQHLVVHRDLKPSNILVSDDGQPKLLDFGIAKLVNPELDGPEAGATVTGLRLMTPGYASPEQIRGAGVTTASDVYSLGVVLFELLTGCRPCGRTATTPLDLERAVLEEVPARPSSLVQQPDARALRGSGTPSPRRWAQALRGDLDNIVLKALEKDPARRYARVDELQDDLRRHLGGRPVRARPASAAYRAKKFVLRHRAGVAASLVAALSLAAGTGMALWQAHAARLSAADAERQRDLANRRFRDVRALANTFLFEFHDEIADVVGGTGARELVVRRGVEYLDRLGADTAGDPQLRDEVARSYVRLAMLQGAYVFAARVESRSDPERLLRRAVDLAGANHRLHPGDARLALTLSSAYRAWGRLQQKRWEPAAGATLRRSLEIAERVFHERPEDADRREHLIDARLAYGLHLHLHAPFAEAERQYRAALALATAALPEWQRDPRSAVGQEQSIVWLAFVLTHMGRFDEALSLAERWRAAAMARLERDPRSADARRSVALAEHDLGWTLLDDGRPAEAIARLDVALARLQDLTTADPDNLQRPMDLGRTLQVRADALAALGRTDEALEDAGRALAIHQRLWDADPTNAALRARVAWDLRRGAEIAIAARRAMPDLTGRLEHARKLSEENLTLDPGMTFDRLNRARCLSALARAGARGVTAGDALEAWRELAENGVLPASERLEYARLLRTVARGRR